MEKQKSIYLTHSEAILTERALKNQLDILLNEYDKVEGEEAKEAARNIINNNRQALKKIKDINNKFNLEYEDL